MLKLYNNVLVFLNSRSNPSDTARATNQMTGSSSPTVQSPEILGLSFCDP
jgi:hypothetical protein